MDQRSSARNRIESLLDAHSFVEIGALVRSRSTDFVQEGKKEATDGVICGYGSISGKPVYVYAQDGNILSGSLGEMHGKKIAQLYDMALKKAKAKGLIPLYSVVYGQAGGAMAVLASLSDFSFMENKDGRLFLNAPDAVKGNKNDDFAKAKAQEEAGNLDFSGTEEELITEIRKAFSFLPANNEDEAYNEDVEDNLNRAVDGFFTMPAREALSTLSDEGEIFEVRRAYGEGAVTAFLRLNGQTVGGIATTGEALHWKAVVKMNRFLRFCNSFSIPVLTLCDTPGFENCSCNEMHMTKEMGELLSAYGNASVPLVTLVKKAVGSAGACLGSKGLGADLVFAYPESEISVMDAKLAANILYPDETLEDREEKAKQFLEEKGSAKSAAYRGYIDAIILPEETRQRVISAFDMLYGKANFDFHKKYGSI